MSRRPLTPLLLALAYPLLAHTAVMLQIAWMQWLALTLLMSALLYPHLAGGRPAAWLGLIATSASLWLAIHLGDGRYALYLPPPVLLGMVLLTFALSLLPGRMPLVTGFALLMRGSLTPEISSYTRAVTWLWTVVLALLLAATGYVTVAGSEALWSLVTNLVNYAVIALVFTGEYLYRRYRFPSETHPGFFTQIRDLTGQRPLSIRS